MADQPGIVAVIDQALSNYIAQWNAASTIIVGLVLVVLLYPIFTSKDPDTHPFLLARQANSSPIRHEGESATYRSTEIPYGYPLRSGLAIKDPGASKWTSGRDGDLRDVWRQAVDHPAKITTILGVDQVRHDLKSLTRDINSIGSYLSKAGSKKVGVCLSNSTELLCTIFAGSFYGFSPVLLPYSQNPDTTKDLLASADFDTLIAEAGSVALQPLIQRNKTVRRIIWVTKAGSNHLDWNEVPEGAGGKLDVSTWHDLLEEHKASSAQVLALQQNVPASVFMFCETVSGHELVEYSQQNLIAGTAALQSSLPRTQKLQPSDTVLPTIPLTSSYALCWSLLTLFTGATLVLNSASGPKVNVLAVTRAARQDLKPTHLIIDARALPKLLEDATTAVRTGGLAAKLTVWKTGRAISQGYLPNEAANYLPPVLSNLKVMYIAQPETIADDERVSSNAISRLRLALGTRIVLALTSNKVAGPVAQTHLFDYRDKQSVSCVGAVAASLELHLKGTEEEMQKDDSSGLLTVKGPAVGSGKEKVTLQTQARVDADNTIVLA